MCSGSSAGTLPGTAATGATLLASAAEREIVVVVVVVVVEVAVVVVVVVAVAWLASLSSRRPRGRTAALRRAPVPWSAFELRRSARGVAAPPSQGEGGREGGIRMDTKKKGGEGGREGGIRRTPKKRRREGRVEGGGWRLPISPSLAWNEWEGARRCLTPGVRGATPPSSLLAFPRAITIIRRRIPII